MLKKLIQFHPNTKRMSKITLMSEVWTQVMSLVMVLCLRGTNRDRSLSCNTKRSSRCPTSVAMYRAPLPSLYPEVSQSPAYKKKEKNHNSRLSISQCAAALQNTDYYGDIGSAQQPYPAVFWYVPSLPVLLFPGHFPTISKLKFLSFPTPRKENSIIQVCY